MASQATTTGLSFPPFRNLGMKKTPNYKNFGPNPKDLDGGGTRLEHPERVVRKRGRGRVKQILFHSLIMEDGDQS